MPPNRDACLFVKDAWGVDFPLMIQPSLCGCGVCVLEAPGVQQPWIHRQAKRQGWYLERCFFHRAAGFHDALLRFICS
jgi:hypothetical protein